MYALISELEENAAVQVMHLWRQLNQACGLEGIFNFPNPHFTWFVAGELQVQRTATVLQMIADEAAHFQVRASGLGIFPGKSPVLYLPVVKTAPLIALHQEIWNQTQPFSKDTNLYYSPALWIPHVTLALMDLTRENLTCAINAIAFEPIELLSKVDNLTIAQQEGQETGETLERVKIEENGNV